MKRECRKYSAAAAGDRLQTAEPALRAHGDACERCRRDAELMRGDSELLSRMAVRAPEGLAEAASAAALGGRPKPLAGLLKLLLPRAGILAAAAAITVFAVVASGRYRPAAEIQDSAPPQATEITLGSASATSFACASTRPETAEGALSGNGLSDGELLGRLDSVWPYACAAVCGEVPEGAERLGDFFGCTAYSLSAEAFSAAGLSPVFTGTGEAYIILVPGK